MQGGIVFEKQESETTLRRLRNDGRGHFQLATLWRERLYEWLLPILWGLMPIVAIVAVVWALARSS